MYIDTGSSMPISPSKSRDENKKNLTEWKWFETTVFFVNRLLFFVVDVVRHLGRCRLPQVTFQAVSREIYVHISVNKNLSKSC